MTIALDVQPGALQSAGNLVTPGVIVQLKLFSAPA
jgi:hypothetical protein